MCSASPPSRSSSQASYAIAACGFEAQRIHTPVKDRRARLFSVIADVFTQKKIRETSAGRLHAVLAWGFFLLFCGTALATLDWDVGHYVFDAQFLQGGFYLAYKFVLDCAGIAVLIALALGAARRWSKESGLPGDARFVCAYLSPRIHRAHRLPC